MANSTSNHFKLVIIGAGPAGLAAAMYAAREDLRVLVLEKAVIGGLAAITDRIDNYPGFDQGVGGLELADHLASHAKRYGADIRTGIEVTGLHRHTATAPAATTGPITITTTTGSFTADAVLIATGSTYRHLGVPGEQDFIGRGVHFCATCDAPLYRDKHILVAGGGNSAIQESLFIAKFARQVTLLVRGSDLSGSAILRDQLEALPNVDYQFHTEVTAITHDDKHLTGVELVNNQTKATTTLPADALFVFIGLIANTEALADTVHLDDRNFVLTERDYATNLLGVYAAGDVRSGSTWQIASAIGEGVSATLAIRAYLNATKS